MAFLWSRREPEMIQQGLEVTLPMTHFQVFGFTDILKKFPKLLQQFRQTRALILQRQPDAVILVDYPGFNLRLAKSLRKHGYRGKIIQLICPTVWAWGKGRIQTLAANYDLLLTIFPFRAATVRTYLFVREIHWPSARRKGRTASVHRGLA